MRRVTLGRSGIEVSEICLGSMTWGSQNTEAEGHAQIDYALERGIDFVDTAEMYPVNPISVETIGRTEEIIGTWNAKTGRRNDLVIATKVSGAGLAAVRDGAPISRETIQTAVEASLRRLQTDHIDLYQLHWPNRGSYMFRQNWTYDPSGQDRAATIAHMDEVLGVLGELVTAGKVRAFGLSNESAWGTAMWLARAEAAGLPRVASVQNEYSLVCRLFDLDMAELSVNEDVTLLAFSPLAVGMLTGKYRGGVVPEGSRMAVVPELSGRNTPRVHAAVEAYHAIAARHGLGLGRMALYWCLTRPFPTIPIVGARSVEQLAETLGDGAPAFSPELLGEISAAHKDHPMPY